MGEELILSSRRIQPAKLLAAGYSFRFPELEGAVRHEWESTKIGSASQPSHVLS
jgi:NAD dependent epimerase/dehydratase family enzyme